MPAAPAHKRFYRSITPMSSLPKPEFKERAQQLRKDILDIDAKVILLKDWAKNNPEAFPDMMLLTKPANLQWLGIVIMMSHGSFASTDLAMTPMQ